MCDVMRSLPKAYPTKSEGPLPPPSPPPRRNRRPHEKGSEEGEGERSPTDERWERERSPAVTLCNRQRSANGPCKIRESSEKKGE